MNNTERLSRAVLLWLDRGNGWRPLDQEDWYVLTGEWTPDGAGPSAEALRDLARRVRNEEAAAPRPAS